MTNRSETEQLKRTREKLRTTRDTLNFVAQQTFAETAARYLRDGARLSRHPDLAEAIAAGVLYPHVFSQKSPSLLALYRRLVRDVPPETAILEIGVKNGGSVALWRHVFPQAPVIGIDINLAKAVRVPGAIYVEGSQADRQLLEQLAAEHSPFGLVIDDGSHIGTDQIATLETLLAHVADDGIYVIEDVHAVLKPAGGDIDYGEDVWPDFVRTALDCLRGFPPKPEALSIGEASALNLAPLIEDLSIAHHSIALRRRRRTPMVLPTTPSQTASPEPR